MQLDYYYTKKMNFPRLKPKINIYHSKGKGNFLNNPLFYNDN